MFGSCVFIRCFLVSWAAILQDAATPQQGESGTPTLIEDTQPEQAVPPEPQAHPKRSSSPTLSVSSASTSATSAAVDEAVA